VITILTLSQKQSIQDSWRVLTESLTKEQRSKLYFRLADLIQYGDEAFWIAYNIVIKIKEEFGEL